MWISMCGLYSQEDIQMQTVVAQGFFEKAVVEGSATHQKGEKKNPLNTERLKGRAITHPHY